MRFVPACPPCTLAHPLAHRHVARGLDEHCNREQMGAGNETRGAGVTLRGCLRCVFSVAVPLVRLGDARSEQRVWRESAQAFQRWGLFIGTRPSSQRPEARGHGEEHWVACAELRLPGSDTAWSSARRRDIGPARGRILNGDAAARTSAPTRLARAAQHPRPSGAGLRRRRSRWPCPWSRHDCG